MRRMPEAACLVVAMLAACGADRTPSSVEAGLTAGDGDTVGDPGPGVGEGSGSRDVSDPDADTAGVADDGSGDDASLDRSQCPGAGAPGVRYVSQHVHSCERAGDFECEAGSLRFRNACGCGFMPPEGSCPSAQRFEVDWHGRTALECESLLADCPAGASWFRAECGCGCAEPLEIPCDASRFTAVEGLDPLAPGSTCPRLVLCLDVAMSSTRAAPVLDLFADATCTPDPDPGCPPTARSSCSVAIGVVDEPAYTNACLLLPLPELSALICASAP